MSNKVHVGNIEMEEGLSKTKWMVLEPSEKIKKIPKRLWSVGKEDPRRVIHAFKVGIGSNAIWAVMTVVAVLLEFFADLHKTTVGKLQGLSRSIEAKRLYLLFLFALLKGASVGPMIMLVIDFDSSVLVTAFVGTAVAFVCFSAAAMLATRREYLYHGASLACCMSILWWVQIASSIFGGSTTVVKFELYFGLLIFVGYIVVDTQMITEKAHHGDMDYVQHSFTFFTDFASLFVQILVLNMLIILEKKSLPVLFSSSFFFHSH
ncbi:TEGT protein homolog [Arabidopsis thaliana]|uniref:TEGT protein homolog n=1 Tax=Arabidopsis thaliana TaxID=3702 RepID=O23599_ARATH|nr:TEGT protein homolog [Arabidopsis thaliana]CAB78761.1 TEGT protein homolog [Arabidopsis thaliana]